jgi:Fe-S-cluster containining protein
MFLAAPPRCDHPKQLDWDNSPGCVGLRRDICSIQKKRPTSVGRCSLNSDPEKESISGVIRNEQEIGSSAIELMLSMIERNVMGLPHQAKILTILSDWFEGSTLKS